MLLIAAWLTCAAPPARARAAEPATLEDACQGRGWRPLRVTIEGHARQILWKAPAGAVQDGDRQRRLRHHFWQDEYSPLVLEFFATRIGR